MDTVLAGLEGYAVPYIDDILIYSESWEAHLVHMETVLQKLSEAKLTAKPSKCERGKSYVQYLGHLVGEGCVSVPETRTDSIREYRQPTTKDHSSPSWVLPVTTGSSCQDTLLLLSPPWSHPQGPTFSVTVDGGVPTSVS